MRNEKGYKNTPISPLAVIILPHAQKLAAANFLHSHPS
jgi:hypothetical protein